MTNSRSVVPLFKPDFGQQEEERVLEVLRSGWIAMGPQCESLEKKFAEIVGADYAIALNSCTAALHLANHLFDTKPGDEVIVPSLTFAATANAVIFTGATPVFADIAGPDDWTISPADIARRITPKTRAVVVMHFAGFPCDMAAIAQICEEANLALIEDACHGLGGSLDGKAMGSLGDIGCFSFYSNKIITTGEGGMLVTNRGDLAERARLLRSHGMTATAVDRMRGSSGYDITEVGYNYRLDDLRAALGLAQIDRLPDSIARRLAIVRHYRTRLSEIPGLRIPEHGGRGQPAHYILPVLVESAGRDRVRNELEAAGVQTSVHYPPVHGFAHYREMASSLPNTEWVAERTLTLPLYPSLEESQVDYVCDTLIKILAEPAV